MADPTDSVAELIREVTRTRDEIMRADSVLVRLGAKKVAAAEGRVNFPLPGPPQVIGLGVRLCGRAVGAASLRSALSVTGPLSVASPKGRGA
jgi:hypothetical protein